MRKSIAAFLVAIVPLAALAGARADSIDDAEAQRRGISVAQVQLEAAQKTVADLRQQLADLQKPPATQPATRRALPATIDAARLEAADLRRQVADTRARPPKEDPPKAPSTAPAPPSKSPEVATVPPPRPASSPSSSTDNSGKSVQVRGYTRKDGTYVAPYTRRAPSK